MVALLVLPLHHVHGEDAIIVEVEPENQGEGKFNSYD